ncbi:hypothetical protein [Porphyrobacter sp. ULC335]|jgi:hypothetical protein|uniref:hypothetical protein n=1 Tax=Porphyrobacter sp. ULC335 TaxID=2854260 RepID=UPI00221F4489|nr:hypothetical protein [Porphyrobacter sp. ULC335]UYV16471.1 hypothetical protein KVF90_03845 [Porphyrobacter sp. ULC335]
MQWFYISALMMTLTAIIHSVAGERRLVGPALAGQQGIFANAQSRKVLRGAWHLTSAYMVLTAAVMIWPDTDHWLKALVASVWLVIGLVSLLSTRGKHVGWPTLTLAGFTGWAGTLG